MASRKKDRSPLAAFNYNTLGKAPSIDFFTASSLGYTDVVEYFLNKGQDINEQNQEGWTALMYACASQQDDTVSCLLTLGCDISKLDLSHKSFFSVAAENGSIKSLCMIEEDWIPAKLRTGHENAIKLRKMISDVVNHKQSDGLTPLMLAATGGFTDVVEKLISLGAHIRKTNRNGLTARALAKLNGHTGTSFVLNYYNTVTVKSILFELDLGRYSEMFARVSLYEFLSFDDNDLKNVGVKLLGPRKKLLMAIKKCNTLKACNTAAARFCQLW